MPKIPFIKVTGSHFSCGEQVGQAYKNQINKYLELCRNDPPANMSWSECTQKAQAFIKPTEMFFPQIIDEIKGAAKGANIDFTELFTTSIEELYSKYFNTKGCTDIVVLPPKSAHTIVAHNNDLPTSFTDCLTSIEWNFDGGIQMFTVGLGSMVSVGVNNFKIVLSGNALTPNDTRVGIPRALIARAILSAKSFDTAIRIATHPQRASSYNNIITAKNQAISIEGSATNFEYIFPKNGLLIHSNHYCSPKMLQYEDYPNYDSSIDRYKIADEISNKLETPIDIKSAENLLTSHQTESNRNNSICRHEESVVTTFGFAADLDTGIVELASGSPCKNPFKKVWQFRTN